MCLVQLTNKKFQLKNPKFRSSYFKFRSFNQWLKENESAFGVFVRKLIDKIKNQLKPIFRPRSSKKVNTMASYIDPSFRESLLKHTEERTAQVSLFDQRNSC